MAVVIGVKREFEFTGNDLNGDACIFPRDFRNHVCVQAFEFATKRIAAAAEKYLAFPYIPQAKIGGAIFGIYSEGDSHAASDKQVMFRSTDNGATYEYVDFFVSATSTFDYSLLDGYLAEGEKAIFKIWTVTNTAGAFSSMANSTVAYGGLTYALWSRPVEGPGGVLFRTGYATNGSDTQTAVFESVDGGDNWTGKAVIFNTAGLKFSEADLINTTGTTWIAVCREDTGSSNPLYHATSADDCVTWGAPAAFTASLINGRQPNLTRLSDGSIVLATGDRSGISGYSSSGDQTALSDTTGVTIWRSTDDAATWGFRTRISPIYSTDGGQPMVIETTAGRIAVAYYARKSIDTLPVIGSALLAVANL